MKNFKKGFTLIELLVVVAIIGILTAVVLVFLGDAKSKASNASVKANLSGLSKEAEMYFYNNQNSYSAVCSSVEVAKIMNAAAKAVGLTGYQTNGIPGPRSLAVCNDSPTAWAAEVPLLAGGFAFKNDPFLGNTNIVLAADPGGGEIGGEIGEEPEDPSTIRMWCVDSTGKSKQTSVSIGTGTVCPN